MLGTEGIGYLRCLVAIKPVPSSIVFLKNISDLQKKKDF